MTNVIVVIGAGSIGQAIARRISAGKKVMLTDLREENAVAAAAVLSNAGFEVSTATVDVSSASFSYGEPGPVIAAGQPVRLHAMWGMSSMSAVAHLGTRACAGLPGDTCSSEWSDS